MIDNLNITAIVENTAGNLDILGEWGLALWIEADNHRILFDTGQGYALLRNAHMLRIDLATAETMFISHGHLDHSGGIADITGGGFCGRVFIHPAALNEKYQRETTIRNRQIGIPAESKRALRSNVVTLVETKLACPNLCTK